MRKRAGPSPPPPTAFLETSLAPLPRPRSRPSRSTSGKVVARPTAAAPRAMTDRDQMATPLAPVRSASRPPTASRRQPPRPPCRAALRRLDAQPVLQRSQCPGIRAEDDAVRGVAVEGRGTAGVEPTRVSAPGENRCPTVGAPAYRRPSCNPSPTRIPAPRTCAARCVSWAGWAGDSGAPCWWPWCSG